MKRPSTTFSSKVLVSCFTPVILKGLEAKTSHINAKIYSRGTFCCQHNSQE